MERLSVTPRPDWQQQWEDIGFIYHSMDGVYWDESHCYRFTSEQIDEIDDAAANLHDLCLKAVDHIITEKRLDELKIPAGFQEYVTKSWQQREPSVFGGPREGVVARVAGEFPDAQFTRSLGKWVRRGHVQTDDHWLHQAIRPQKLAKAEGEGASAT